MSVVTPPQVGNTATFRFDYPLAAAGHWYFHLLTLHEPNFYPVPIPGFVSLGSSRIDLFNIRRDSSGLLDASGSNVFSVGIPPDNFLAGLPFDVQSVDLNFFTNTLYWASNDAEVRIVGLPPEASFTAANTFGALPLVVQFADSSTNAPTSWQWDFTNDGIVDSIQQNPSFTCTTAGVYSVRLVATNLGGASTSVRTSLIYAGPSPALNMVPIAAGTFQMGSTFLGGNSAPVHPVTITRPFWIGAYEVTQAQYQAVLPSHPNYWSGAQRPADQVSWNSAMAYCSALTAAEAAAGRIPAGYQYRLPTEAEWEYCCRAGTTTEWNTGAALSTSQANFDNLLAQTTLVGSYAPNAWGLFDMHGNQWEWCLDSWDGTANYPLSAVSDPYGTSGIYRFLRGGSYNNGAISCASALRFGSGPSGGWRNAGVRVVLAPILVP
jgi:formylglycine-generating enzyme required for sulfatase activity